MLDGTCHCCQHCEPFTRDTGLSTLMELTSSLGQFDDKQTRCIGRKDMKTMCKDESKFQTILGQTIFVNNYKVSIKSPWTVV